MGDLTISGIGQADDTSLISNSPHALQNLLHLSLNFCSKYHVKLCVEKTKLQVMSTKAMSINVQYLKDMSPINIEGKKIDFVHSAEHVGILRSIDGNLPNLLSRLTAHKKALAAVLYTGMSRRHRGNPAASLKVNQIYGVPVLLSGLGALVLLNSEIDMLDHHHKATQENLLRLLPGTPSCVTAFLSGSLPGTAHLHLRQMSIFGMICRMPANVLHQHAIRVLTVSKQSSRSWFLQIRNLCLLYGLPHPLHLLQTPHSKIAYKSLVKKHVVNYWEVKLREEASSPRYSSLNFFRPQYMSLCDPHPMLVTAGASPYAVTMCTVQSIMLSGRYRTEELLSHWSESRSKFCKAPTCFGRSRSEDLPHILAFCPSLASTRRKLMVFTFKYSSSLTITDVRNLILKFCSPAHPEFSQFLVDCSTIPEVIATAQRYGPVVHEALFHITRTWCYALHRDRMRILGRWRSVFH